jgi:hypothetical protein
VHIAVQGFPPLSPILTTLHGVPSEAAPRPQGIPISFRWMPDRSRAVWKVPPSVSPGSYYIQAQDSHGHVTAYTSVFTVEQGPARTRRQRWRYV